MSDIVRFSHLKAYGRSAMHGRHSRTVERPQTAAMQLGEGVDALLFGHKQVCGFPGAQRRGKEWEQFQADHDGQLILTGKDYDRANRMTDAIRGNEVAAPFLIGAYQQTILFRWNAMDCRATPDVRNDTERFLTELKTSASSDPARFAWHALRMQYHAQMRMQNIACRDMALDHYIVCCEAEEPYPVTVFRLTEKALEVGEKLLIMWSETLKNCEASQTFPPYSSTICEIDMPDEDEVGLVFAEEVE